MSRRVLVARLDSLGDVLVTGPAVRAVASGADEVVMLCGPEGTPAAEMLPGVDRVFTWAAPWIVDPSPAATPKHLEPLQAFLAAEQFDQAVIFTSFHQSPLPLALLLRLAGVPLTAGASVDFAGSLLDVRLKPGEDLPEDLPEPERALAIAEAAGYELPAGDDGRLAVQAPPPPPASVGGQPYIAVHPGASVPAREWPAAHHAAAVELLAQAGHRVVVTGGPSDAGLTAQVAGRAGLDLGGRTGMRTLAGVLAGAEVVITGNTGPAHLAAAVGTPVVSLFSPVVPAVRWAPYGVRRELLGDQDAPCRNTRARVCPVPGHPCLASVTPREVVDAVERILADPGRPAAPERKAQR
ncbi:glycosyltransferase family 9 protein [Paenarthrobacter sp. DKR-5]|uniref:glycosyltransferase family 9 protein n=1 Tax=Paenarthrobacter sp. DKR-5 TaxID=2835535 RepID=UPI001BDD720D|nr:glycosyltransferase family 9 protein [Paenarthrobacter sp. DKR-5]MBT1001509.1 glycosyltransferase family 9 protein [Paenarthrobacter sp. DKR-5]